MGSTMREINRTVLLLKPKGAFLEILKAIDATTFASFEIEDIQDRRTAYLVPQYEDKKKAVNHLRHHYEGIYGLELARWVGIDAELPSNKPLSWKAFKQMFDFEFMDMAIDNVTEPIIRVGEDGAEEDGAEEAWDWE